MTPDQMDAELSPALEALRELGAPLTHYKVCSTFDSSPSIGSIGKAIDIASKIFDGPFTPVVAGAPALGRYCVFGNLFASLGAGTTGEVFRLDRHPAMVAHPVTPADEADLRRRLAVQTEQRVALLDVTELGLPSDQLQRKVDVLLERGAKIVLIDILYPDQLKAIGALLDHYAGREQPLFVAGSSGVAAALGAHWSATRNRESAAIPSLPGPAGPILVASGSCSPVTRRQIETAVAGGFAEITLNARAILHSSGDIRIVDKAVAEAIGRLTAGRNVIVHTGGDRTAEGSEAASSRDKSTASSKDSTGMRLGGALAQVIRRTLQRSGVQRICVAGGDTASYAARDLEIESIEMIARASPGAPLCRVHAPGSPVDRLEMIFKGGQVGADDYFLTLAEGAA